MGIARFGAVGSRAFRLDLLLIRGHGRVATVPGAKVRDCARSFLPNKVECKVICFRSSHWKSVEYWMYCPTKVYVLPAEFGRYCEVSGARFGSVWWEVIEEESARWLCRRGVEERTFESVE